MSQGRSTKLGFLTIPLIFAACAGGKRARDDGAAGSGTGGQGGAGGQGGGSDGAGGGGAGTNDPKTCAEAAARHSYVGCDFWPVPLFNATQSQFDFTVVVANAGAEAAEVTVDGNSIAPRKVSAPPGELVKIFLPWNDKLFMPGQWTSKVPGAAYHLVSTRPVTVYQFSPLEYQSKGGPPGKDWGACAATPAGDMLPNGLRCRSESNDASLLIPTTALTSTYRVSGYGNAFYSQGYFAVVGTENGTDVTVKVGPLGQTAMAIGWEPAHRPGETFTFALAAGEVAQILGVAGAKVISGSLVTSTKPVEVIAGHQCTNIPEDKTSCDHLEETVMPLETLGKRYLVHRPTGPGGGAVPCYVRLYGLHDGTALSYAPFRPMGARDTIAAGEMIELPMVSADFDVRADKAFAVTVFQLGSSVVSPGTAQGDPAMSNVSAVEQFRTRYIFLAPDDYDATFADVTAPEGTTLTLDGKTAGSPEAIDGSGFAIHRLPIGPGAHVLEASAPVGLQVSGYGKHTSYQFPGGLDLRRIGTAGP